MAIGKEGNVKWVDGLRGVASIIVVMTHLARSFDGILFSPSTGMDKPPRLLQWPLLRIGPQGRIGVTIFAFVTGYVCALKPFKLCRQGNQDAAFATIGRSALRRTPRLFLPAALITAIIWVFTQLGTFRVARQVDSGWARGTAPEVMPTAYSAVMELINQVIGTWTRSKNTYDGNQWTMFPLLKGSFQVYVFLVAFAYVQPRYRMMAAMGMWLYFYISNDASFGMQFFWGVFLSDLQNHAPANDFLQRHRRISRVLAVVFLAAGLMLASFPEYHHEWTAWSRFELSILRRILPEKPDLPKFASGLGLELVTIGLHFSPAARDVLANRWFLWLGRQSFAVYLLHGPLLRSVLVWMVYGVHIPADFRDKNGNWIHPMIPYPGHTRVLCMLPFWLPMVYGAAVAWTTYVDPMCARWSEKLVGYIVKKDDEDEKTEMLLPVTR